MLSACTLWGQAKKPIIMVIPSDAYCNRAGYVTTYQDANGKTVTVADYEKAFIQDEELRLAISELSTIMSNRQFPLKDLEATLKNLKNQSIEQALFEGSAGGSIVESPLDKIKRTAKADIIMDLDFSVKKNGPRNVGSSKFSGVSPSFGWSVVRVSLKFLPSLVGAISGV